MGRSEHIDYLDGWRGLAILVVLIAHFGHLESTNLGLFGVELFFVLSGLLMARILYEQRMPIGEFYRRRIARICPLLYLFILVVLVAEWARGAHVGWKEALALPTFTRTYVGSYVFDDPFPVQHIWSLNVEEHCYLLLAVVASIAVLRNRAAAVLVTLAMLTFAALGLHHLLQGQARKYLYDTECAATALLLSAGYRLLYRRVRVPAYLPLLALALAPWFYLPTTPGATRLQFMAQVTVPPFLLAFAVNHLETAPAWFLSLLRARWLRLLGVISYSVYIWQQPLYLSSNRFPFHSAVLCAVLIGCASFYLYESPVRRWLNLHWSGPRRHQPEAIPETAQPASPAPPPLEITAPATAISQAAQHLR